MNLCLIRRVFCNLCCCGDVIAEIASDLDLSLRSIENKYIGRNCVAKL